MSDDDSIFIEPKDFDIKRLVIKPIQSQSYSPKNGPVIDTVFSEVKYLDDSKQEKNLWFSAPKQTCFGISYKYGFTGPKDDPNNITGMQACYPVTSSDTIDKPTSEEKQFDNMMTLMHKKFVQYVKENAESPDLHEKALNLIKLNKFVKEAYSWRKVPVDPAKKNGPKKEDRSKPRTFYCDIPTTGKQAETQAQITVFGPGDEPIPASSIVSKLGEFNFVFAIKSLSYATQGASEYAAKPKFLVVQASYVPKATGTQAFIPKRRLLPSNPAIEGFTMGVGNGASNEIKTDYTDAGEGFSPADGSGEGESEEAETEEHEKLGAIPTKAPPKKVIKKVVPAKKVVARKIVAKK